MRVAAIDIGTNSVLLLVADVDRSRPGELRPIHERATITRLGQGVDRTRALAADAATRTLDCLASYAELVRAEGAERLAVVGTSAMRDAKGGDDFVQRAGDLLGVAPRVISGDEEAELTFEGALVGLHLDGRPDSTRAEGGPQVVVFDIGGGSTELIFGSPSGISAKESLNIGSVRLTERHVRSDPPRVDELERVRTDAREQLATIGAMGGPAAQGARWVGVAGTVTTIAALVHDVAPYDGARVHGARVRVEALDRTFAMLSTMSVAERRSLRALDPARADVIVAGCIIVQEVLRAARADEMTASDRGVRWGLALRLARGG